MQLLNKFSIKSKTYMLVSLSVLVALTLSLVSNNGLSLIKAQVDELIRANNIERYTYRAILEEKNYLLNANGSVNNHQQAKQAFINAEKALKTIYSTLDEMDRKSPNQEMNKITEATRNAITSYDRLYQRGVYLLNELEKESQILQKEGENITSQIQQYVEAKRVEIKEEMSQETIEKINAGSNIWQYTYMTRADEKRYLLSPDDAIFKQFKHDYTFMMSELERLKVMSTQSFEHEKIANFYQSANNYEQAMVNWVKYNKEHVHSVLPKTKELGELVIDGTLKIADNAAADIVKKRQQVITTLIMMTLLAIVSGILFGTFISRSIFSVIQNFQTGLLDFFKYLDNQKNSAQQITIKSNDEIAVMAQVVNENIIKIEEVMEKKLALMKEKDQQLLKQSRLAQMGEMLAMIAHQWRQPLGAITATTSDMEIKLFQRRLYDFSSPQGQQDMEQYSIESLYKINALINHLSKTIDDFSNFFKADNAKNSFKLQELMDKTLNLSNHLFRSKGIEIIKHYDVELHKITSFENEIMQVLLNIIHNSVDVLVDKNIKDGKIDITIEKNNQGNQTVSIKDNGGGIPADIINKIFDPYFSTKDKNGTGLGLYMSKMIIEEHCQGKIMVKNLSFDNLEKGACFTIEFLHKVDA
jgi:signal transduction histidine kinase